MGSIQSQREDTTFRRRQHTIIDTLGLKCANKNCSSKPVSLFIKLCNHCVKKEVSNYKQSTVCAATDCSGITRSPTLNFCLEHTLSVLDQLGIKKAGLHEVCKVRWCRDDQWRCEHG